MSVTVEFTQEIEESELRQYLATEGWDFFDAADHFETTEVSIKRHVNELGVEPDWKDAELMSHLADTCDSIKEAADEIGLSRKGAAYWFDQYGIERPSAYQSEAAERPRAGAHDVSSRPLWETFAVEEIAQNGAQRLSEQTTFERHWDRLRAEALELYHS